MKKKFRMFFRVLLIGILTISFVLISRNICRLKAQCNGNYGIDIHNVYRFSETEKEKIISIYRKSSSSFLYRTKDNKIIEFREVFRKTISGMSIFSLGKATCTVMSIKEYKKYILWRMSLAMYILECEKAFLIATIDGKKYLTNIRI